MPEEEEKKLRRQAQKLKRQGKLRGTVDQYVYGTMRKHMNWTPSHQKKTKKHKKKR